MTSNAIAPYRARLLGSLGDDPATVTQIVAAGFDPGAPGVTYTVDDAGNVMQNLTVTAPIPKTAPAQPAWPLIAALALIGFGLFSSGRASR